ncbi:Tc toxin subunit A-related protein [Pseudomonas poae]|uniref:Insecticidal toxin protein n=1 Tax=Pseudomonas poae TaxID=200451 RepID=A0A2S9F0B4_9PSED|nr:neuraminidase-like domain-containing protein [Pseudomonas poae]PRA31428.1 insecticidal toxin protein [Pseudomonas poae]PRC23034.1 insecticidal toxin protein [Pseudomonas poae]
MSHPLNHRLNESLRDAMLAYYLNHKVPASLQGTLNNVDDLYEHWLLDVQVSQAVPTSPVACAISSLQQYITRIQLGLEPGYEQQHMTPLQDRTWREQLHAYPVWSASQQLRYHPANYLDPSLRSNKTDSFQQLENDLSQCRLQPDTVLMAIQGYLARFEEIANIRTLNGYIDGNADQLHNSTYYFIGKSTSENTYYWRALDMSRRSASTPTKPSLHAWSDWKKINLTLPDDTVEQTIRPVFFNNRLYFIWAQCIKPAPASSFMASQPRDDEGEDLMEWVNDHYAKFRLSFSYKKYDDSWSVPHTCIDQYCATEAVNAASLVVLNANTQSIAIAAGGTPDTLFLGLYAAIGQNSHPPEHFAAKFFQAVEVDQHFNISAVADGGSPGRYKIPPGSELSEKIKDLLDAFDPAQRRAVQGVLRGDVPHENGYYSELLTDNARKYFTLFGPANQGHLQFKIAPYTQRNITVTLLDALTADNNSDNYENKQPHIRDMPATSPVYDLNTNSLIITSTLDEAFRKPYSVTLSTSDNQISVTLRTDSTLDDPGVTRLKLGKGSHIIGAISDFRSTHYALYIKNPKTQEEFTNAVHEIDQRLITATENDHLGTITLEGRYIDKAAFIHLYTNRHIEFNLRLARYSTYNVPTGKHRGVKKLHFQNALLLANISISTSPLYLYKHVIMGSAFSPNLLSTVVDITAYQILNFLHTAHDSVSGTSPELPKGHSVTAHVPLVGTAATDVTVLHGVITLEATEEGPTVLGYALKAVTLTVETAAASAPLTQQRAPAITRHTQQPWGNAEFIDFSKSALVKKNVPGPIRLNTCFAAKLVQTAGISVEHLYRLSPQQWQEPPLSSAGTVEPIDFHGAAGKHFWELFLYLPWLVAHRLNHEQQYAQAQAWLHYIFDPTRAADVSADRPHYWGFNELVQQQTGPNGTNIDPHFSALGAPVHFRKAIYLFYLDILINRGDAAYRHPTPDNLTQAKLWYTRASQLLQTRPKITTVELWANIRLEDLEKNISHALRQLERQAPLIEIDRPIEGAYLPQLTDTDNLCLPFNPNLVARWDKLESRLHNLRHNFDITGKPLHLPLYAAPLAPQQLLASQAKSSLGQATLAFVIDAQVGHYRFHTRLGHAQAATDALMQFASTLLSLYERKEQAEYLEMQQQQAWDLANIVVSQQTQALVLDERNRQALEASRGVLETRLAYYDRLLTEGVSRAESQAGQLYLLSASFDNAASVASAGGGIAMLAPNIAGTAFGGSRWEGAFYAVQALAQGTATALRSTAADLDRTEHFNRRAQEWAFALQQTQLELAQLDAQRQAYAEQEKATRLQLRLAQTSLAQARSNHQLLAKRFTKAQLYGWVNAQLSQFYDQTYEVCQSLCLAAQACWQYEMADFNRRFVQVDAWNNPLRGYLAGESLKLSLLNMNAAYLDNPAQDLEIIKTVSLRHHLHDCHVTTLSEATDTPPDWARHMMQLVKTGNLHFKLTKALFDQDYPGHVLRRINSISVSLPATLGPYEDVRAMLTQTRNETELPDGSVYRDMRAHQQIALSTGLNDDGLFTLTFNQQERYLPFEYTGAISDWSLSFPVPSGQKTVLESINDIVIHLRYTARSGDRA